MPGTSGGRRRLRWQVAGVVFALIAGLFLGALAALFLGRTELIGRRLVMVAVLVVAGGTLVGALR